MGLFVTTTDKELLEIRKKIFLKSGLPLLEESGYKKSPFSTANFGKDNSGSYFFELCKLTEESRLHIVSVNINSGDKYIQIRLNAFQLDTDIKDLNQLKQVNGIQYCLPPNSLTNMRLHVDDFKGIPLFNFDFNFRNHQLTKFFTKSGLQKSVKKLSKRIEKDLKYFKKYEHRWFHLFTPLKTTVEGKIVGLNAMTVNERLHITGLTKQFEEARRKNKEYAANILTWLEVDKSSINKILDLK